MTAVQMIRDARRVLAAFLPPDSGISRAQCVTAVSRILFRAPVEKGPDAASTVVHRGREITASWQPTDAKLDRLFELLESPEARQFDPRMTELVYLDV